MGLFGGYGVGFARSRLDKVGGVAHWAVRAYRGGMLSGGTRTEPGAIERFNQKIHPEPNTGCWLWTGATFPRGYAAFKVAGRSVRAHRWAYEQVHGPIPEEFDAMHRCGATSCVNPDHLELKPRAKRTRVLRANRREACVNGHRYTPENTKIRRDGNAYYQICLECHRVQNRAYMRRRRQREADARAAERGA